jgi:hypothetical protein
MMYKHSTITDCRVTFKRRTVTDGVIKRAQELTAELALLCSKPAGMATSHDHRSHILLMHPQASTDFKHSVHGVHSSVSTSPCCTRFAAEQTWGIVWANIQQRVSASATAGVGKPSFARWFAAASHEALPTWEGQATGKDVRACANGVKHGPIGHADWP